MIDNSFKRVLIIGQPFNNYSGGGITLTNLFRGWPRDKIAVVSTGHLLQNISFDVCNLYYQLGREEQFWMFPFSVLQKSFPSGPQTFKIQETPVQTRVKTSIRKVLVDRIFFPVIQWIGLFHCLSKITLSQRLIDWLSDYKPEVLYLQISTREQIIFSQQLIDHLNIPTALHMMDDWPSTISNDGLFKEYWRKKIDKEFRQLLDRIDLCLSISNAMSSEYLKRYKREFMAFHNSIDISKYLKAKKSNYKLGKTFRILYIGRIGTANKHSIYFFANAISNIRIDPFEIYLDIISNDINSSKSGPIEKVRNVRILPPVDHKVVPDLLHTYDLLFLPLDFTETGLKFARYSMPTKASEYFASGTPVLVFAPKETAISKFCSMNECGFCITEQSQERIENAVQFLIRNEDQRQILSANAVRLAKELFSAEIVGGKFHQILINTSKNKKYV
ncbi:MAG TPA: glycosyltransferase [Ignavibacteria bacterium]